MATKLRPARLVALDWMLEQADNGEHESAGPNRSPLIDKINENAGVSLGSSYCAAAVKYAFSRAGVYDFGGGQAASVGFMDKWADKLAYRVTRPKRGDAFAWNLDGDNWPDHAGMVDRVISWGGLLFTVKTVEANTSSSVAGSQGNGGGFYRRTRTFTRGRVDFIRDPAPAKTDPYAKKPSDRARVKTLRGWLLKRQASGWSWKRLKATANWAEYRKRGGK